QGGRLTIRHKGRADVPPLISIAHFTVDATVTGLWHWHVRRVTLEGLDIEIPPTEKKQNHDTARPPRNTNPGDASSEPATPVIIDELIADDARLAIIPSEPDRPPKVWAMHELHVDSVAAAQPMTFRSILTNAVPPGTITTSGSFGPWNTDT